MPQDDFDLLNGQDYINVQLEPAEENYKEEDDPINSFNMSDKAKLKS